jgi:hypothetical protein
MSVNGAPPAPRPRIGPPCTREEAYLSSNIFSAATVKSETSAGAARERYPIEWCRSDNRRFGREGRGRSRRARLGRKTMGFSRASASDASVCCWSWPAFVVWRCAVGLLGSFACSLVVVGRGQKSSRVLSRCLCCCCAPDHLVPGCFFGCRLQSNLLQK